VAHPRSNSPATEIGSPIAIDVRDGCESHANAITRMNPNETRSFATTSAYGLGKALIGDHLL
jgi:hypothetical protein